jgi:outer membrane protein TolC
MLREQFPGVVIMPTSCTIYDVKYRVWAIIFLLLLLCLSQPAYTQQDTLRQPAETYTLDDCIAYALQNQPQRHQSQINVRVAKVTNRINLAGWLPQVSLIGSGTHYNQLPTSFLSNTSSGSASSVHSGVANTLAPQLTVSQAVFNPQLVLAAKSARLLTKKARQELDSTDINVYVSVSKAFYNLLLILGQIDVLKEDTAASKGMQKIPITSL